MRAVKLADNIYWVGAIDWTVRSFHGYATQRGATYNAYLILDEKITLIDTVKDYLTQEMMERISELIDPSKIDYVVANHAEPDHSGALPALMELAPNATVITSPNGVKNLKAHYKKEWNFRPVQMGETLSLGKRNLNFVHTQMVHWPDNMVAYLPEDKILFSNDAFGQHYATSERFADEVSIGVAFEESKKYYANIVLPFGQQVKKALDALADLEIEMIATSHGLVWRKNQIPLMLRAYEDWSSNTTKKKAVIVYDSMWHSTEKIAHAITQAFENKDYSVRFFNVKDTHISDIMTDVIDAEYICVGSSTLNNNMMPTVAGFLAYFKGLAPKNRKGLAFGSYGWGGQSIGQIEQVLKDCGFETLESIRVQFVPDESQLAKIRKNLEEVLP